MWCICLIIKYLYNTMVNVQARNMFISTKIFRGKVHWDYKSMFWLTIVLSLILLINSSKIGVIDNYIMISTIESVLSNLTREQCVCGMIRSNTVLMAINYFSQNQTCQQLSSNTTSILIGYKANATFIFINQSMITIQVNSKFLKNRTFIFICRLFCSWINKHFYHLHNNCHQSW